jgi:hypothetical protein
MARFDPDSYPDRLAFEEYAHRIRDEEIGRAFRATVPWLDARRHEITRRVGQLAVSISGISHRHSVR